MVSICSPSFFLVIILTGKSQKIALEMIARDKRGDTMVHIPEMNIAEVKSSTLHLLYYALVHGQNYIETAKNSIVKELASRTV